MLEQDLRVKKTIFAPTAAFNPPPGLELLTRQPPHAYLYIFVESDTNFFPPSVQSVKVLFFFFSLSFHFTQLELSQQVARGSVWKYQQTVNDYAGKGGLETPKKIPPDSQEKVGGSRRGKKKRTEKLNANKSSSRKKNKAMSSCTWWRDKWEERARNLFWFVWSLPGWSRLFDGAKSKRGPKKRRKNLET